jgi:endonuclease/exonuclease/phosphatase family metal-dependent hydrolase
MDGRRDAGRVTSVICDLDCDAIGLQEVDSRSGPHADSMHEYLAHHRRRFRGRPSCVMTAITAMRCPATVLTVRRHDFSFTAPQPRGALDVDLDIKGTGYA